MKKMKLSLDFSKQAIEIFKETKNFARRYHTVHIENCESWNKDVLNIMKKFGNDLRQLQLNNCEFSHKNESKAITKIFRTIGKLEVLKMYDVDLDCYDVPGMFGVTPLNMEHLKSVVMHESSWNVSIKIWR